MTRRGILAIIVAASLAWLGLGPGPVRVLAAGSEGYKIIVHPDNPVTAIDRQFLREAYLRKANDWNTGAEIRPIDLASRFPVRERFVQDVLKKTPSQLKSYWNQQIFSGKGVPPPQADSVAAVVGYVLANPGAVGYVPLDTDVGRAKVVGVN
jgi:ABC-type phosphate transport system substrate-binding protein